MINFRSHLAVHESVTMQPTRAFFLTCCQPRRLPDFATASGGTRCRLTQIEELNMNVQGEIKGDKLVLTIDISKAALENAKPSSSGKTKILATTSGFTGFGPVKASLNVTIPA